MAEAQLENKCGVKQMRCQHELPVTRTLPAQTEREPPIAREASAKCRGAAMRSRTPPETFGPSTASCPRFALAKVRSGIIIDVMIEDLYEAVGGRATLNRAIDVFYKKVLEDDELRPFFKRVDIAHLRSRQVMFVSMLLGGRVYTGKSLDEAHALSRDHGLNGTHFDLFLKYFRAALEEVGVKAENAEKLASLLERKRAAILLEDE